MRNIMIYILVGIGGYSASYSIITQISAEVGRTATSPYARVNRRLVDDVSESFYLTCGSHMAKLDFDRMVHANWTSTGLPTSIFDRSFRKLPFDTWQPSGRF
jgi:hypothetical protein